MMIKREVVAVREILVLIGDGVEMFAVVKLRQILIKNSLIELAKNVCN